MRLDSIRFRMTCVAILLVAAIGLLRLLAKVRVQVTVHKTLVPAPINPLCELITQNAPIRQIEEALASEPARVGRFSFDGSTPLSCAVSRKRADVVKFLLQKGADPKLVSDDDDLGLHDPLTLAVTEGDAEIAKLLIEHGADPFRKTDRFGGSAYDLGVNSKDPQIAELMRSLHPGAKVK